MIDLFVPRPEFLVTYEDESWFSRYAMPRLRTFSPLGEPIRIPLREAPRKKASDEQEGKAVAAYGVLTLPDKQIWLQDTDEQPASQPTWNFLQWILSQTQERGKRWLVVFWDNARFHLSRCLKEWIRAYNRSAGREGGTRLVPYALPRRSPWLNPIEPHWLHCKRAIYSVQQTPTREELKRQIHGYFDARNSRLVSDS